MRTGIDPAQLANDLGTMIVEQMIAGVNSGQISSVAHARMVANQASGITGACADLLRQRGFDETEIDEFIDPVVAVVREKLSAYRAGPAAVDNSRGAAN
jgi:Asp-tRNA(Asn)/Glu-tRNA(Gln) amidotransferase B subunit